MLWLVVWLPLATRLCWLRFRFAMLYRFFGALVGAVLGIMFALFGLSLHWLVTSRLHMG
jgi:hypothetical protein